MLSIGQVLLLVLLGGLVNWIVTLIIVEGAIFDEVRNYVKGVGECVQKNSNRCKLVRFLAKKMIYLVGCHLCVGTWVGFAEAGVLEVSGHNPLRLGFWLLNVGFAAFAMKAAGHLILQVSACLGNLSECLKFRAKRESLALEEDASSVPKPAALRSTG